MSWFKTDDLFYGHPKVRRAGLEAIGLWSVAGSHAAAYKLEGFAPGWFVESWPNGVELAERLVKARLWEAGERDGEEGWFFHDWDDHQPSADQIERQREKSRERQRRFQERKSHTKKPAEVDE